MPFTFQPFQSRQYQPQMTEAIATQIGLPGNAQAAAELMKGRAAQQATYGIQQGVDSTLGNLIAHREREADPGYQLEKLHLQSAQEQERDDQMMRGALQATGGDPEKALEQLRAQGQIGVNAAGKLQGQIEASRRGLMKDQIEKLDLADKQLRMVTQILPEPPKAPAPEDEAGAQTYQTDRQIFARQYRDAIPRLQAIMGPQSQGLPSPDDPDLPAKIDSIRQAGLTVAEKTAKEKEALELARQAHDLTLKQGKESRESDEYWTKATSVALSLATSQEDWDARMHGLETAGAPKTTLARFGGYSPTAADDALRLGQTPDQVARDTKAPELGTLADYMETYSRNVLKRPASTMSAKEKTAAAQQWAQSHHVEGAGAKMAPKDLEEMLDAVEKHPSIFQAITPDLRGQLIGPLNARGFTQFEKTESPATVAANKKWAITENAKIDKAVLGYEMTAADAIKAKAAIRAIVPETGDDATSPNVPARPPTAAPAAAPAPAPTKPKYYVGQKLKMKDGSTKTVGKVYPDGTWDPQ